MLFIFKAIYDYVEKESECSFYYKETDSIYININVPIYGSINDKVDKMKSLISKSELGRMKDEISNETI